MNERDDKYLSIFEYSPVPLWAVDISRLRSKLDEFRVGSNFAVRRYVAAHPEFVQEAAALIEVTDVNRASLRLFSADRKEQILGPLSTVLASVSSTALEDTVLAIGEGASDIESESTALTLGGKKLSLIMKSHIPPADAPYPFMLVSLLDVTGRKQPEAREGQSANIIHNIIEFTPDLVFVKDTELRMVLCNSALSHAIGKEPEETYGKTDIDNGWSVDLVKGNPERGITGWEKDDLAALSGKTVRVTEEPVDFNKGIRYFDTVKFPLRNAEEVIVGLVGIGRDITDGRQMERDLAWERSLFTMLMKNLPDHIYFKDTSSRFIRISQSLAGAFGLEDSSNAAGKTDADFFGSDHAQKALDDEQKIMKTGAALLNIEERETFPNRPDAWVVTTKMPLCNPKGAIVGTFGISHDITIRKKLEEKNQYLATLVDSANDAIVGLDLNLRVVAWNMGAERLYGYTAEEMIGDEISVLVPAELEDQTKALGVRLANAEQISHFETVRLRKDGSKVNVSLAFSPIRDVAGTFVGTVAVAGDITEQKALQAQLNRVQRLESLATLAGGIAHQFNNINMVVKSYLELIRVEAALPARLKLYVKEASAGVQRAVDITERLLILTEPAGSSSNMVWLETMVRALLPIYEKRIEEDEVHLTLGLAETAPVQGDAARLEFVLSSLIRNALDALVDRSERSVSIRTGIVKDAVYFEVQDTGCGMTEALRRRIFDPFFSSKGEWAPAGSPQARLKGVGLSLAISNTIVSEYGGRISVESAEGSGSTFTVEMPVAKGSP